MKLPERVKELNICNWKYMQIYLWRNRKIRKIINSLSRYSRILDAGCGDGFLTKELNNKGIDTVGIDINFKDKRIKKGNITNLPFKTNHFDLVLCLDVLEYLSIDKQNKAISEFKRVMKDNALVVISFPNQTHFAARLIKVFKGNYPPTDNKTLCLGDMSFNEFSNLLKENDLRILNVKPCLPTYLPISTFLIIFFPKWFGWLLHVVNKVAIPNLSFLNIYICEKIRKRR